MSNAEKMTQKGEEKFKKAKLNKTEHLDEIFWKMKTVFDILVNLGDIQKEMGENQGERR